MINVTSWILFWGLIFPLGMIYRFLGEQRLDFSWKEESPSYWEDYTVEQKSKTQYYRSEV